MRMVEDINYAELKIIVLAAGKGTRITAGDRDAPKVMRQANGKPMLWYVLDALPSLEKEDVVIVVGYKKDDVIDYFDGYTYAEQKEQLGTGHAVMAAREAFEGFDGTVLVCYGDMPLVRSSTYEAFLREHNEQGNDCTILTGESSVTMSFGRILRGADGGFLCVREERDCTPEELKITELNSGVYVFHAPKLFATLKKLKNNNSQGEYYLTDVPAIMRDEGAKVGLCKLDLGEEIIGVNTLEQLAQVEDILKQREAT